MLNSLRKGAGTWVAKIFIAVLVLSFAVWGIADIFSGYGSRVLAKVGDVEVSPQEYERVLQRQTRRVSAQIGQRLTTEQIRAFGLDRQVLNGLISNAAVSSHARQLGLGISDQNIRNVIDKSPAFKGDDGKFSRIRFEEVLRNNNMNDQSFIAEQRVGAVRDQLILSLSNDLFVPELMKNLTHRYDNDTRTIEYFILSPKAVKKIKDPDEKTQKAFLTDNKRLFTAPEYRKVGLLVLSADIVKKGLKITDADIAKDYKDRIDQFSIPGKRHIRRMSFIDREKAAEAHKKLSKGADFMTVAKEYGFKKDGTDMGFIDKAELLDAKIADIAFALQKGKFSDPIASSFSTVILQVVDIKPGKIQKKLSQVKDQIRTYLLNERTSDKLGNLQDTIEDDRAGGKALADIAKDLELDYRTIEAVDRQGRDPKGKAIKGFPQNQLLLKTIFESDIGVENEPVEVGASGIFWPEVLGVTPQRLKKLEEVKEKLVKVWKERQKEAQLSKVAADLVSTLRKGEKLEKLARKYKAKVKKSKAFSRSEEHDDIPVAAVNQAFVLPVGGIGMNSLSNGKGRVIFKVVAKGKAKPADKAANDKITARLRRALEDDVVGQYIATLRKNYGVSINEKVLARLNGTTQ